MQRCRISQAKGQSQKRYRRKTAAEQKKRCAETKKFRKRGFLLYFSIIAMFCRKNSAGDGIFFLKTVRMCDPHRSDHTSNGKGEKKMDALNQAIAQISDVLWNSVLLFLLVGTGVYFSVRTRFVQVRKFKTAWNRVFGGFSLKGKKAGKDGMTSFQALATAIEPETSQDVRPHSYPAAREPSSGCGLLRSSAWQRSTVRRISHRSQNAAMRVERSSEDRFTTSPTRSRERLEKRWQASLP